MKKLLALVLALVMTMALAVTSNAAFKDADSIDYKEAVDVMNAVGVFVGDEKGNFNAKENLTREQAAKIIAYLELGEKAADALVGGATFTDVAATRWSAGFIGYCAQAGVVAGTGDSKFDPAGQLTALQFGKMLLVEIGYDAKAAGMTGTDWAINTSKLLATTGLMDKIDGSVNQVLTREQAAQMCLNALKTPTVEYATKGSNITVNGAEINFGASTPTYVRNTVAKDQTISRDTLTNSTDFTVELGEKLYKKLTLKPTTDDFGRPAHEWKLATDSIGVYADEADATYTTNTKINEIYADLGLSKAIKVDVVVDGAEPTVAALKNLTLKKNDTTKTAYGAGAVMEFFYDDTEDKESVTLVVINQYLAEVTKVKSDDDGRYIVVDPSEYSNLRLNDKTFHTEDFDVDDLVVLNVAADDNGKVSVVNVYAPEAIKGTVDAVEQETSKHDAYIELDGTKYNYNKRLAEVVEADPTLNEEYTLYLDNNNYIVGYEAEEEEAKQYAYVAKVGENEWEDADIAKLVLTDATTIKADIAKATKNLKANGDPITTDSNYSGANKDGLEGYVVSYTKSSKDVYTLTRVGMPGKTGAGRLASNAVQDEDVDLSNKSAWISDVLSDEDTLFVDVADECTYTGFENLPNYENANIVVIKNSKSVAEVVFIISYDAKTNDNSTYFYVANEKDYKSKKDADDVIYHVRTVYVDGEKTTLNMEAATKTTIDEAGWYKATKSNGSGYVSNVTALLDTDAVSADYNVIAKGKGTYQPQHMQPALDGTSLSDKYWYYNDKTQFVLIDGDDVTIGAAGDMVLYDTSKLENGDEYTKAVVVKSDKNLAEVVALYVTEFSKNVTVTFAGTGFSGTIVDGGALATTNSVAEDSKFQFTLSADAGKLIKSVKIGTTTLTPNDDGVYTVLADEDKTVTVTVANSYGLKVANSDTDCAVEITFNGKSKIVAANTTTAVGIADNCFADGETYTLTFESETGKTIGAPTATGATLTVFNGKITLTNVTGEVVITFADKM